MKAARFTVRFTSLNAINPFEALDEDLVPPPSLLREFIGGGIYDY